MGTTATFEDLEVWKQSVDVCTEVYQITNKSELLLANRLSYISDDKYNHLLDRCLEVSKQLSGFITYLKNIKSN